jgi:hypothetical protein
VVPLLHVGGQAVRGMGRHGQRPHRRLYGVRQGSILGLILFIALLSGMAAYLRVGDGENVVYADDSNVWQMGRNVEEVVRS